MTATTAPVRFAEVHVPAAARLLRSGSHGIAWRRLSRLERVGLVAAQVAAAGLLFALVQTCQEQVRKGEQLRAEQRQMAASGASPSGPLRVTTIAAAGPMPVTP